MGAALSAELEKFQVPAERGLTPPGSAVVEMISTLSDEKKATGRKQTGMINDGRFFLTVKKGW